MIELGGNITLVGFKEIGQGELVVVKKMVGSYARKFSDTVVGFEHLTVTLKPVHKNEGGEKYELHAKALVHAKPIVSETVDRNIFVGLDEVLSKIFEIAEKHIQKEKDLGKEDEPDELLDLN